MARRDKKKGKIGYIILFVVIIVAVIVFIGVNQNWFNSSNETSKEEDNLIQGIRKELESSILESNLLNPEELNNEIISKLSDVSQDEAYVVRIQYKLKALDNGTIYLYYKINNTNLMRVNVNISEKKIDSIDEYSDDTLLAKYKIGNYLKENVQEDFESKKDKLDSESKSVNVIITNTEVVINTSVD